MIPVTIIAFDTKRAVSRREEKARSCDGRALPWSLPDHLHPDLLLAECHLIEDLLVDLLR
jgi:hypothetical protein